LAIPTAVLRRGGLFPAGYLVTGETSHPNFPTADFALVRDTAGNLVPRLVEGQAFPSIYGYQSVLCSGYRDVFGLDKDLRVFLGGTEEEEYWALLARTIIAGHDPENVVLTELDPLHQKTRPDFEVTAARLGIAVVDIRNLQAIGDKLHYRNARGRLVPIRRIYNRAIADELIARKVRLPFQLTHAWDGEWAGHPNWYFLISKFSIPWLSQSPLHHAVVPPAVFLSDFREGRDGNYLQPRAFLFPVQLGRRQSIENSCSSRCSPLRARGFNSSRARRSWKRFRPRSAPTFCSSSA
jgi:hypothetical protein